MPLKYRIALAAFSLATGTLVVLLWQTLSAHSESAVRQQDTFDRDTVELLIEPGKAALITEDYGGFQRHLEGIRANPHIVAVLLADAGGHVVAGTEGRVEQSLPELRDNGPEYWRRRDLIGASGLLGTLAVRFSNAELLETIARARNTVIVIATAGTILVACASALLGYLLSRRLERLHRAAERLAAGNSDGSVTIPGRDEVGGLAASLNRMAAELNGKLQALKESEARNRALVQHSPHPMFIIDVDTLCIAEVNDKGANLAKLPRSQLIGIKLLNLGAPVQPDGRSMESVASNAIQRALAGETVVMPWIMRDSLGFEIPCEVTAVQLPWPGRRMLYASVMDVTERKLAAHAMAYRLDLENLIARLSTRMISLTPDTTDAGIQQALQDISTFAGVDHSEILQFDLIQDTVSCTHEWCGPGVAPQLDNFQDIPFAYSPWVIPKLRRGELLHIPHVSSLPEEAALERANMKRLAIRSALLVPIKASDAVLGFIGFYSVRTEKNWSEDTIALLNIFGEMLANVLERRRADQALREHAEALERSNVELQQFAYIASHDLQEPLRSIGSFASLLARRYKGKLDQDADEFIHYLTEAVTRLHRMISDLLDYSRIQAQARPFELCDLGRILESVRSNLNASIAELRAEITHGELPAVMGDPSQLMQLLQNLVGNALKFHGKTPPSVHIEASHRDHHWLFSVRDNGIGISREDAQQLFQIFKRLHGRDKYPGTGIGLAVCKRIVERHHGQIWVEPNPDQGSTFYFTLPVAAKSTLAA